MNKKLICLLLALSMMFTVLALAGCGDQEDPQPGTNGAEAEGQAYMPEKELNIIVQAGAGGGSDIFARTFASIAEKNNLYPKPIVVENRAGGSGAIAYGFVGKQNKGNPNYLAVLAPSFLTTPLHGNSDVTYEDFNIISRLGADYLTLMVDNDSKWQTVDEFVQDAKANPGQISMGGTNVGAVDHATTVLFQEAAGVELNYVPFKGGGEVTTALLGGHVDAIWANPSEALEQVEAGNLRALGVTSENRMEGLDVPTFKENGIDLIFNQYRGFAAPKDISEEARQYLEDFCKQVFDTPEYQQYLKDNFIAGDYLGSNDFTTEIERQNDIYKRIIESME